MTHDDILKKVTTCIDVLIEASDKYEGLFPSLLDLDTHEMLMEAPECIAGQRRGDRSHRGSNLIHDELTLHVMYALSDALGNPTYAQAADRYLKRFATHCTDTCTGLFPWGEHSYWDLVEDRIGNSSRYHDPNSTNPAIHDQLRQAPPWLWEKLYEFNPRCVERYAEGLEYHWKLDPPEYSRHGEIEVKERPVNHEACSFDFPRHGGFYIQDWSFAYLKTGRQDFLSQIKRMADYWWPHRFDSGLLPNCSRVTERVTAFYQTQACGQTMGFAASVLESSEMLKEQEPELAAKMREQGTAYATAFVNAPHDLEKEAFLLGFKPGDSQHTLLMPIWGSAYGVWQAASMGLLCLLAYRQIGDAKLLEWAEAVGRAYLREQFPDGVAVPANDAGLTLGLLADLYDVTGDRQWLDGGLKLAEKLVEVYLDGDLPRGAAGVDYYESQMGPSLLLHGLARMALLAKDREICPLEPNYTSR